MHRPVSILIVDKSGRADCALEAFYKSPRKKRLFVFSEVMNPGFIAKAVDVKTGRTENANDVVAYAKQVDADFVFIGPEEPLAAGLVDALREAGIPAVGPVRELARLETSKSFTRDLLHRYKIPGNPEYCTFRNMTGLREYLRERGTFVVKPDGLTGGKGVKVSGEHLQSIDEAVQYCQELFESGQEAIVIEERLDGEEFSFQSFCDGVHLAHTIPVQDHKRALNGDLGPNTGGMGSYSCEDHLLPFLSREHVAQARKTNELVASALSEEMRGKSPQSHGSPEEYKGILYGSFILTKKGLRVIEYNARFGDPEIMNVLPLLKSDFIDVCEAIISGNLDQIQISFRHSATVCKYIVPEGYPISPWSGTEIRLDRVPAPSDGLRIYYAAVKGDGNRLILTNSRAIAMVGIGATLKRAEEIAEDAASKVEGRVFHRSDIGTAELIARRISHIDRITGHDHKNVRSERVAS